MGKIVWGFHCVKCTISRGKISKCLHEGTKGIMGQSTVCIV